MRFPRDLMNAAIRRVLHLFVLGFMVGHVVCSMGCATIGMRGERGKVDPSIETEVTHVVWDLVYAARDKAPSIRWVSGDELTCTDDRGVPGFKVLIWDSSEKLTRKIKQVCRQGFTFDPYIVSVALIDGVALSDSAMAHEFAHAFLGRQLRGDPVGDPDHHEACFAPLANCGDCQYKQPDAVKYCRPGVTDPDCVMVQKNPCGECGIVEWANEQLRRIGR